MINIKKACTCLIPCSSGTQLKSNLTIKQQFQIKQMPSTHISRVLFFFECQLIASYRKQGKSNRNSETEVIV